MTVRIRGGLMGLPFTYEALQKLFNRDKHLFIRNALAMLDLPPRAQVLDIGCGTGQDAVLFADNARYDYLGVDICAEYIRRAEARFPSLRFKTVDVRGGDIGELAFDVVLIDCVTHHMNDNELGGLMRLVGTHLSPGGFLVLQDIVIPRGWGLMHLIRRMLVKLDRGSSCRRVDDLDAEIAKHLVIRSRKENSLRVAGLKLYDMATFVCSVKNQQGR